MFDAMKKNLFILSFFIGLSLSCSSFIAMNHKDEIGPWSPKYPSPLLSDFDGNGDVECFDESFCKEDNSQNYDFHMESPKTPECGYSFVWVFDDEKVNNEDEQEDGKRVHVKKEDPVFRKLIFDDEEAPKEKKVFKIKKKNIYRRKDRGRGLKTFSKRKSAQRKKKKEVEIMLEKDKRSFVSLKNISFSEEQKNFQK